MARSALSQLEQLREREIAARNHARQVERDQALAAEGVRQAKESLVQAIQRGDDQRGPTKDLRKAEELAAQPWAERVEAAKRSAREAASAVTSYIAGNWQRMRAELEPQAEQVREDMLASLHAVEDKAKEWERFAAIVSQISQSAGFVPRYSMPRLGLDPVLSAVRAVHDVAVPMPADDRVASAA